MLKVPARAGRCQRCQQPFQGQQPVVSFLVFGDEEILRSDCCDSCAQQAQVEMQKRAGQRPVASWRTKTETSAQPPSIPSALLATLRQDEAKGLGLRWLLALYLERQRVLVLKREQATPSQQRWYEYPETGEIFQVQGARPDRQDLADLQRLLATLPSEARQAG